MRCKHKKIYNNNTYIELVVSSNACMLCKSNLISENPTESSKHKDESLH